MPRIGKGLRTPDDFTSIPKSSRVSCDPAAASAAVASSSTTSTASKGVALLPPSAFESPEVTTLKKSVHESPPAPAAQQNAQRGFLSQDNAAQQQQTDSSQGKYVKSYRPRSTSSPPPPATVQQPFSPPIISSHLSSASAEISTPFPLGANNNNLNNGVSMTNDSSRTSNVVSKHTPTASKGPFSQALFSSPPPNNSRDPPPADFNRMTLYSPLSTSLSEKLESQRLQAAVERQRLLDQICILQSEKLNLLKRLEGFESENKALRMKNDFLQRNCRNSGSDGSGDSGDGVSRKGKTISYSDSHYSPLLPSAPSCVVDRGVQVGDDGDSGVASPPTPSLDFVAYVDLKRKFEEQRKEMEVTSLEMEKRDKCIATLKSLLLKIRPGKKVAEELAKEGTDAASNYVPLLDDDEEERDDEGASFKSDAEFQLAQLRRDLVMRDARIEALNKMLKLEANSSADDEDDVSAVTKKYKGKVLQLLTQNSLKDVELQRLETAVELAAGSRIDLQPVRDGGAAVAAAVASQECAAAVDSSMIPFIEKLGKSCDSLYTAFATPLEGVEKRLRDYESRIHYGNQRVKMVQSLMARKASSQRIAEAFGSSEAAEQRRRDVLVQEIDSLKAELDRVARERESLAIKMKNDSSLLEDKMNQAGKLAELNDSLNEKLETANQRITYLEDNVRESREALTITSAAKEEEIKLFQTRLGQYEKALREREASVERVVDLKVESIRKQLSDERSSLQNQLEDTKRGLVLATTNYTQIERLLTQERQSGRAILKDLEASQSMINSNLKDEIHKLQTEIEIILGAIRRYGMVESLLNAVKGNPRHQSLVNRLMSLQPSGGNEISGAANSSQNGSNAANITQNAFVNSVGLNSIMNSFKACNTRVATNSASHSNSAASRPLFGQGANDGNSAFRGIQSESSQSVESTPRSGKSWDQVIERSETSRPAVDLVINNLESEDNLDFLDELSVVSGAESPAYSPEQMMAAIRELQNDVLLLANGQQS